MVAGGAHHGLCAVNTRVQWWDFFWLRRGRHDACFLNGLADKHAIFSILNKGPWRHLSLPVSPCYETLFSCLSQAPVGMSPGKVPGTGAAPGLHPGVLGGSAWRLPAPP